jgi:hypothetical protein
VLLCSASNTHNRKNLNRSIAEALTGFAEEAAKLREADIDVLGTACGSATFRDFAAFSRPRQGIIAFRNQ